MGKKTAQPGFDKELDALFANANAKPASSVSAAPVAGASQSKRKREAASAPAPVAAAPAKGKKAKVEESKSAEQQSPESSSAAESDSAEDSAAEDEEEEDDDDDDEEGSLDLSDIEKEIAEQGLARGDDEEEEELDSDEEEAAEQDAEEESRDQDAEEPESDSDEESGPPVHEALGNSRAEQRIRRKLEEREKESKDVRDQRTLFLGNVPIACVQDTKLTKALQRHIVALSPYPSITHVEALRYRSVAFSVPTADYAAESGADAAANEKRRARARAFKNALDAAEGADKNGKPYLNSKQKRKVAYINQEINDKAKSVNAYVTLKRFSERDLAKLKALPGSSDEKVGRLTEPILAALTAAKVDETLFEGRHLRGDLAKPLPLDALVAAGLEKVVAASSTSDALTRILSGGTGSKEDKSRTLFVGNLDFEADEEDLRAMLEGVLRKERGNPPSREGALGKELSSLPPFEAASSEAVVAQGAPSWVQSVRIVRDAATQLGKGIAYVKFHDEICVDELMAVWEADEAFLAARKPGSRSKEDGLREDGSRKEFTRTIKLNKRALRLARCKTAPGAHGGVHTPKKSRASHSEGDAHDSRTRSAGAPTPGGSSPSTRRARGDHLRGQQQSSPSRKPAASSGAAPPVLASRKDKSAASAPSASSSGAVPNPGPKFARSEAEQARLALKRNDPERQARRAAKKDRKREELKLKAKMGSDANAKGKVDLKIGKKRADRNAGGKFGGKGNKPNRPVKGKK